MNSIAPLDRHRRHYLLHPQTRRPPGYPQEVLLLIRGDVLYHQYSCRRVLTRRLPHHLTSLLRCLPLKVRQIPPNYDADLTIAITTITDSVVLKG